MRARGVALGEEFRGKGVRFVRVLAHRLIAVNVLTSISCQGLPWACNGYRTILFQLVAIADCTNLSHLSISDEVPESWWA